MFHVSDDVKVDEMVSLIVCCFAEAAKVDLQPDELRSLLQTAGVGGPHIDVMSKAYKVRFET